MISDAQFQIRTQYNEGAYRALAHLIITKLRRWPRYVILLTGVLIVLGSISYVVIEKRMSAGIAVTLLAGNLFFLLALIFPRFVVKLLMASNKKGEMPEISYLFNNEGICIRSSQKEQTYSYNLVHRVIEMSGYLFFFFNDGQIYLMNREDVKGAYIPFKEYLEEMIEATKGHQKT